MSLERETTITLKIYDVYGPDVRSVPLLLQTRIHQHISGCHLRLPVGLTPCPGSGTTVKWNPTGRTAHTVRGMVEVRTVRPGRFPPTRDK